MTRDVHTAYLELLVATLDEDEHAIHDAIEGTDPVALAHNLARRVVQMVDTPDHPEMRADLVRELLGGALP